jgi:hypothetical protein
VLLAYREDLRARQKRFAYLELQMARIWLGGQALGVITGAIITGGSACRRTVYLVG